MAVLQLNDADCVEYLWTAGIQLQRVLWRLRNRLIVTYVFYLGKDVVGPTPAEALSLSLVLFTTACLLAE